MTSELSGGPDEAKPHINGIIAQNPPADKTEFRLHLCEKYSMLNLNEDEKITILVFADYLYRSAKRLHQGGVRRLREM